MTYTTRVFESCDLARFTRCYDPERHDEVLHTDAEIEGYVLTGDEALASSVRLAMERSAHDGHERRIVVTVVNLYGRARDRFDLVVSPDGTIERQDR